MTTSRTKELCFSPAPYVTNPESGGQQWRLDGFRQILRASGDAAYLYLPLTHEAGSIIDKIAIRWGGGGTGDGIIANVQRREAEGSNKYFSDVTTVQTFTRGAEDPEQQISIISDLPITLEEGYSYVLHITSKQVASYSELYDIVIRTRKRLL